MKTILLTGSEGYVATNFYNTYKNQFNFIKVDRKKSFEVLEFQDFDKVDYIIHLAAISGIANCELDRKQTIYDNVTSTLHLIRKSKEYNIPMVFASSQGAKEPDNLYSITKKICEIESILYNNEYDTDIKILRFANIYGGIGYLETKTSVVSKFINATKNNQSLIIDGDGNQIRDFIHVDDICTCIYKSLDIKIPFPIDVGTGYGTSVSLLANMMNNDKIIYNKKRKSGTESNIADTADIRRLLGFKPKNNKLEKYIKEQLS